MWTFLSHLRSFAGATTLALLLLLPASLGAQISRSGAALEGLISDQTGALIPSARVQVRNTATGLVRVVTTDQHGSYLASALPVGTYEVSVKLAGFAPYFHTGVTL